MSSECYRICNEKYSAADPRRIYCKKGCDSDEETLEDCKLKSCAELCIKDNLGDDSVKLGAWSKLFSRAPTDSHQCLNACYYGCNNKEEEEDDDNKSDDNKSDDNEKDKD
eukprot:TRINITY_DN4754_c0_g1_i1.p1 TRINITY_DN4754_c0_g1~~TRINITY_DN4754_c0_g1_i1.p1  ORF type:complete len:110 (+),score=27.80 TRINITY_DN4754_c0_g1_i1:54-383(+)